MNRVREGLEDRVVGYFRSLGVKGLNFGFSLIRER